MRKSSHFPLWCLADVSLCFFAGSVQAQQLDITQPGDDIIATSNNSPGSEGVANAIDNQPTKYLNFDRLNTGFTVSPRVGLTVVNVLTLTSANDAPERDPADYTLEGSHDGMNFTLISSGAVPAFPTRFFKNTILFSNSIPYLHYRLIFPNVVGFGANSMQISEVELLGVLADRDVTTPGDPIVATSNNSPGSEGVANAIDDQPTKYLNFDRLNTGFTVSPRVGPTVVGGLTLTSANDAPERDPAEYVLAGSNDGTDFVPISSGAVPSFPTRFHRNYIFFPNNTEEFTSYRLIFPNVAGPGGNSMQISEVEFLGHTRTQVVTNECESPSVLIQWQPVDTPVLPGFTATFRVGPTGPWKVQWFKNGQPIAGANNPTYTTPAATTADDGTHYYARVEGTECFVNSDEVTLTIFTPSATESIGLSWRGSSANGAPTDMLAIDITGFHQQAYWNNLTGGSGTLAQPLNSANQPHDTITVTWAASGEWGVGARIEAPIGRMFNGMATSASTSVGAAQTATLSGVPVGSHTLLLYTVQVAQEFFNMDFLVVTHDSGGNEMLQWGFMRPQNSDEFNLSPGFSLVTSETPATRGVGNMMRFDNVQPGPDGIIQVRFFAPGRIDLPGGDPIRGPGLNGMQLILNPPDLGAPPVIAQQPASANGIAGSCITLCVEATGPNLAYQWLKDGQAIVGATDPCLTLANLSANDAGSFAIAITNPAGKVHSRNAVLDVVASTQLTLGLIDYFKLEDGGPDGLTALNSAGGGQNGQIQGLFADFFPAQIGNGLILDQSFGGYVVVADYPKVSRAITVAGWVYPFSEEWGPIINNWVEGQTTGQSGQFLVEVALVEGVPTLRALIEVGPNRVQASAPIDGTTHFWHHFAMSANGRTLSIYWDGMLVAAVDYLGSINSTTSIPWLALGANLTVLQTPVGYTFHGGMDDLALWNRSLSGTEIQGIYAGGLAGVDAGSLQPVLTEGDCPVSLMITRIDRSLAVISWPSSAEGHIHEQADGIAIPESATVWTPVGIVPTVANGFNAVTVDISAGTRVYRLRHPAP